MENTTAEQSAVALPDLEDSSPSPVAAPEAPKQEAPFNFKDFEPDEFGSEPRAEEPHVEEEEEPPVTTGDDPPHPNSNNYLRQEVKRKAAEAKAVQEEFERYKQEREQELEELRRKREEFEAYKEETDRKLLTSDVKPVNPWETDEVKSIGRAWEQEFDTMVKSIENSGGDGSLLRGQGGQKLLQQYASLDALEGEAKRSAIEELNDFLDSNFPDDKRDIARMFTKGVSVMRQASEKAAELAKDSDTLAFRHAHENHKRIVEAYRSSIEDSFGQVPESLRSLKPDHPDVIIDAIMTTSDDLKAKGEQVKKFLRYANLPLAPMDKEAIDALEPHERNDVLRQRVEEHEQAKHSLQKNAWKWAQAYYALPSIYRKMADLEERLRDASEATPRPKDQSGEDDAPKSAEFDVKTFEPAPFSFS